MTNEYTEEDEFSEEDLGPSKTKRKKEMQALQDMGGALIDLSKDKLKQLNLPENLLTAVMQAKKLLNARGAQRRQLQYIGKLMREVDPAPIQAKLDAWSGVSKEETNKLHLLERWRERLLSDDAALSELMNNYPGADAQYLRTLIRNVHKELLNNKPPKSSRALFKSLREVILGTTEPEDEPDALSDDETE